MRFNQRIEDLHESVDDVIQFENPNEAYFGASPEDIVVGNFSFFASVVQFFVGGQLHEIVVLRNQQFLENELI
jgi:hypothetical protein